MPCQRPSFQFYPRDWASHPGLAGCSLAARGLWMSCVCIMHDAPVYGRLLKADGSPMAVDSLARRVGESPAHVRRLLEELLTNGVGHRAADGAVESPRMMRDEDHRNRRAAGGVLGGNPALLRAAKDNGKVNLPVNHDGAGKDNRLPTPASAVASASALPDQKHPASPAADAAPELTVIGGGKTTAAPRKTWLTAYGDAWKAEMGGEMAYGQAATVFKKLEADGHSQVAIVANLRRYCRAHQGERASFASLSKFGETFTQWGEQSAQRSSVRGPQLTPAQQARRDRYTAMLRGSMNG